MSGVLHSHRAQLVGTALAATATTAALLSLYATLSKQSKRHELQTSSTKMSSAHPPNEHPPLTSWNEMEHDDLVREHLARNYAFFGDDAMAKIRAGHVVVVGCGGVGSWAAVMLVRSYSPRWVPGPRGHDIRPPRARRANAFTALPILLPPSSTFTPSSTPSSTSTEIGIPVVYSTEIPSITLLPFPDSSLPNAHELSVLSDWRVRIFHVLRPLPALFGLHIATYVLCQLAGKPIERPMAVRGRRKVYERMVRDLQAREARRGAGLNNRLPISEDDVALLFDDVHR
ncbi:hypothetical protein B0H12DRAFT_1328088 [Mycena haematopus]|nr:hypothetical protein B0H12DRAFT_1328088 [Mycena haematopus]